MADGSKKEDGRKGTKPAIDREGCIAFGKRLVEAREAAGFTQATLARHLSVSRSAVGQWELGHTYPVVDSVRRIADAIRVTPEYLLYGVSNSSPERLSDSIPLIDKVDGKERVVTSFVIPKDAIMRMGLTGQERLRAVTVFNDGEIEGLKRGDIVVVNTEDKDIRHRGTFVFDNHDRTAIGTAQAVPGSQNKKMHVNVAGDSFDLRVDQLPIVGRVVSTLLVGRAN